MRSDAAPLCIDLDGTLIRTDLVYESALALARRNPLYLFCMIAWIARGKAQLKRQVALRVAIDATRLPYDERVLEWLRDVAPTRRRVLATASDELLAATVAEHVGGFDEVIASDGVKSLGGRSKRDALCERYGERGFDYAGNAPVDLPVWRAAREAIVVDASPGLLRRAQAEANVTRVFARRDRGWRAWMAALRPHQWTKNLLLFVPLLAAHLVFVPIAWVNAGIAYCAFCLCASAAYVLNDLLDLDADRRHPRKFMRPFAAGHLPIRDGLIAALLLTLAAFAVAMTLSTAFALVLLAYAATTLTYSLVVKRVILLDVFALAALYTLRIFAGAVAVPVALSSWLLVFSMFLFLSLAMLKRYAEIQRMAATDTTRVAGRGYRIRDLPRIRALGIASGCFSVLVLAFYIASTKSMQLYRHHQVLWMLTPLLVYWINRVWRIARRGRMHDDPVVFALTDPASLVLLLLFAGVIFFAV